MVAPDIHISYDTPTILGGCPYIRPDLFYLLNPFSRASLSVSARSSFLTRLYHSHPCERPGSTLENCSVTAPGVTLPPASMQSSRHSLPSPSMEAYRLHPCNRTFYVLVVVPRPWGRTDSIHGIEPLISL